MFCICTIGLHFVNIHTYFALFVFAYTKTYFGRYDLYMPLHVLNMYEKEFSPILLLSFCDAAIIRTIGMGV